nr:ATP synthase subunit I [Megasphaera sp. SW808]
MVEEFVRYVKATVCKLIGFTCFVAAVLAACGEMQYITGWCIGNGINIVYFLMLTSRSARAVQLPPARAVALIRGGAVLRLVMIVLVLIVVAQFPSIHFGAAVAGLFTYRVTIFADMLIRHVRQR